MTGPKEPVVAPGGTPLPWPPRGEAQQDLPPLREIAGSAQGYRVIAARKRMPNRNEKVFAGEFQT
jgi:hypothetical protein